MKETYLFYDLETSGRSYSGDRILQFAGQRTDLDFKPIGEPYNFLIRPSDDMLPEIEATLITGITPQKALDEGISEREATDKLLSEIFTPQTTIVGYNSIRFDNKFLQFLFWRNYADPYSWSYQDGRRVWDIIDVVRMCRALRPEGIEWPVDDGAPSARLELLTKANNIEHSGAHDALADVNATIEMTKLIKNAQPKLFSHLRSIINKSAVSNLIDLTSPQPLVHTSGMLGVDNLQTSVVWPVATHPSNKNEILAWDLRYDPADFAGVKASDVARLLFTKQSELEQAGETRLPIKGIHINHCPALAPIGVLDDESMQRIDLSLEQAIDRAKRLDQVRGLIDAALAAMDKPWRKKAGFNPAEERLYDGFASDSDRRLSSRMQQMKASDLPEQDPGFDDERLSEIYPRYLVRNLGASAPATALEQWQDYRQQVLTPERLEAYASQLQQEAQNKSNDNFLLEELSLWLESIIP